eukprot:scaffold4672_cov193-Alexandrium_tamarense.AAC.7
MKYENFQNNRSKRDGVERSEEKLAYVIILEHLTTSHEGKLKHRPNKPTSLVPIISMTITNDDSAPSAPPLSERDIPVVTVSYTSDASTLSTSVVQASAVVPP